MAAGIIKQKNGVFAIRILGECGIFTAKQLRAVEEVSERYGNGVVTATSRGTFEITGVHEADLEAATLHLTQTGLTVGGNGPTVRAVIACKGTECTHGLFDVHALAAQLERALLGQAVPKKFKIGVFGCPNSLGKARSQDAGILPSMTEKGAFDIYIGGMMGKNPALGERLPRVFTYEQLLPAMQVLIEVYNEYALPKERFRAMLDRCGGSLTDEIMKRMEQI